MPAMPEDPVQRAQANTEQFWRNLDAEMLSEPEAAQSLGLGSGELVRLRQAGEVLAVDRGGVVRYPAFQFQDGQLRPVITKLTALRIKFDLSETDVVYWLYVATTYFREEDRPVDHLDDPDLVAKVAEASWGVAW